MCDSDVGVDPVVQVHVQYCSRSSPFYVYASDFGSRSPPTSTGVATRPQLSSAALGTTLGRSFRAVYVSLTPIDPSAPAEPRGARSDVFISPTQLDTDLAYPPPRPSPHSSWFPTFPRIPTRAPGASLIARVRVARDGVSLAFARSALASSVTLDARLTVKLPAGPAGPSTPIPGEHTTRAPTQVLVRTTFSPSFLSTIYYFQTRDVSFVRVHALKALETHRVAARDVLRSSRSSPGRYCIRELPAPASACHYLPASCADQDRDAGLGTIWTGKRARACVFAPPRLSSPPPHPVVATCPQRRALLVPMLSYPTPPHSTPTMPDPTLCSRVAARDRAHACLPSGALHQPASHRSPWPFARTHAHTHTRLGDSCK
ncbi:hypothetical protein HETIRDRAFT_451746 [Heterobasidion irregulare TC 32-1]|uniref:Uncharacterized protein n=1 Tax=Heterobasidion irregulare (strain TC 32-1) TaxID=747525 RepID=W4K8N3_HETIT|nr:uncharacterized protein HETIRDRAFT_451746 [Heterobasidion irregulare TC 32-1]ETW82148.1 hypothetical protein HETIRDRAFT_451746 [Heterobasidion irregulare TC 32-1]